MKKNSLRIFSILMVLLFAVTLPAGCGKSGSTASQSTSQGQQQTGASDQTAAPREKIKLSWAGPVYGPVDKDCYAIKELQKAFPDVEFDLWALDASSYNDQLNVKIAGGEIPDIIFKSSRGEVAQLVKQSILGEVPYEVIKQYAPNYFQSTVKYGKDIWIVTNIDGKNYGLPQLYPDGWTDVYTMAWRKDYLDNLGIAKIPETLQEYEEAFKKIVNDDPDKNGKKDTIGMSAPMKDYPEGCFTSVFAAYGVLPFNWMLQPDGTVKYGIVTPQVKEAFKTLNKWYKLGYIDREFVVTDSTLVSKKWTEGKTATDMNPYYYLTPGLANYDDLVKNNPGAKVVLSSAPKGPEGRYGFMSWSKMAGSYDFSKDLAAKPNKLNRVLEVLDKMMSDKQLNVAINYGIEGTHWKRDEHGGAILIPPYNDFKNNGSIGNAFFQGAFGIPEATNDYNRSDLPELIKYSIDGNVKDGKDYFNWILLFTNPDLAVNNENARKVALKAMIQFITGERPIDQFDQFVKEWEAAGGDKLTEDANNAYKTGKAQLDDIASKVN